MSNLGSTLPKVNPAPSRPREWSRECDEALRRAIHAQLDSAINEAIDALWATDDPAHLERLADHPLGALEHEGLGDALEALIYQHALWAQREFSR